MSTEENTATKEPIDVKDLVCKAEDPMTEETGAGLTALFELDIAKCEVQKARLLAEVAHIDLTLASIRQGMADVKRRVCGVDYPKPAAPDANAAKPEAETGA